MATNAPPPCALQDESTVLAVREIKTPHLLTTHLQSMHPSLDNESIVPFHSHHPQSLAALPHSPTRGAAVLFCYITLISLWFYHCASVCANSAQQHSPCDTPNLQATGVVASHAFAFKLPVSDVMRYACMRRKLLLCAPLILGSGSIPAGTFFFFFYKSFVPHLICGWSRDDIVNRSISSF